MEIATFIRVYPVVLTAVQQACLKLEFPIEIAIRVKFGLHFVNQVITDPRRRFLTWPLSREAWYKNEILSVT